MHELLDLTIADAGRALRSRQVTAVELTEATLAWIDETEPELHAYVTVMGEHALDAARQADHEIKRGFLRGPMQGIPIGVKDLCCTRDAPTEAGSRLLKGFRPSFDATAVRRLRDGGAVIVGKTVTHEFGFGPEPPPTRNAWHQDYAPVGSSAGSAVAVAARSAFATIGTDGGGSIRAPASANGVVGLKPTCGLVSRRGVFPMSASLDHVGPIARTAVDCGLVLSVIAGYDRLDSQSLDVPPRDYIRDLQRGVHGTRIGVERTHMVAPETPGVTKEAAERAAGELEQLGAALVEVAIPEAELAEPAFFSIMMIDTSAYHRRFLRDHAEQYGQGARVAIEVGELIPGTHYVIGQRARVLLRRGFREVFEGEGLDVLLVPGWGPAPLARETPANLLDFSLRLSAGNLTGLPAMSVPCGFTAEGLPLSFELYGRPFEDATILRVARAYEEVHPWFRQRPPLCEAALGA